MEEFSLDADMPLDEIIERWILLAATKRLEISDKKLDVSVRLKKGIKSLDLLADIGNIVSRYSFTTTQVNHSTAVIDASLIQGYEDMVVDALRARLERFRADNPQIKSITVEVTNYEEPPFD